MIGKKESQFTVKTNIIDSDFIRMFVPGQNLAISFSDFKLSLGVTGTLTAIGDPLGVPVLQEPTAGDFQIRTIESGAGVIASVSPENGITLDWNVAQDVVGFPITSGLTNPQPVMSSLIAGTGMSIAQGTNSLILSATGETTPTNTVIINQESDFPVQNGTTITLSASTRFVIGASFTTAKRFICQDGFVITFENQFGGVLTYSGTGDMFTGSQIGGTFTQAMFDSPNANQTFNFSDSTNTKVLLIDGVTVLNTPKWGTYDGLLTSATQFSNSPNADDGITILGSGQIVVSLSQFAIVGTSATCKQIDFGAAIIPNIEMNNLVLIGPPGAVQVTGLASNGNVPANSVAMMSASSVIGGASQLSGISVNDFRWLFNQNSPTRDTRPDGLASIITNSTETVISASSTDGSNAVKVAGTWVIEAGSHFTVDTTGRITYNGEREFTAPIDCTVNVLMASGSTKNISAYLSITGAIERATEGKSTPTSSLGDSAICHWQHTFVTNDFVEVFLENQSDSVNIIGVSGVLRVN